MDVLCYGLNYYLATLYQLKWLTFKGFFTRKRKIYAHNLFLTGSYLKVKSHALLNSALY